MGAHLHQPAHLLLPFDVDLLPSQHASSLLNSVLLQRRDLYPHYRLLILGWALLQLPSGALPLQRAIWFSW